jgi:hypothetical protein
VDLCGDLAGAHALSSEPDHLLVLSTNLGNEIAVQHALDTARA